jgi:hypothetical protein
MVHCRRIPFSTEERLLEMIFECYHSAKAKEMCVLLFCALVEQPSCIVERADSFDGTSGV